MFFQSAALVLLLGGLYGIESFGTSPFLRRLFLPNASCRYLETSPTYCFFFSTQDGLTTGYSGFYVDVIFLVLIVIFLVLLLGRLWCSWLCPFGFSQELLSDLRNRLNLPPLRLKWAHRMLLRQVKYAILFFKVCPAKGFFTVLQQAGGIIPLATSLPLVAVFMLVFFLVAAFTTRMFWCRVCPMGGFMSLFSTHSFTWLHKDADKCTKCRICLRVCPMDHDKVYEHMDTGDVGGQDCTLCTRCVEMCPEKDCLSLNFMSKRLITSKQPKFRGIGKASPTINSMGDDVHG